MPAPSRLQVLSLYKQLIKNANHFSDYNFRNYFLRRTRDTFKANKSLQDQAKLENFYKQGINDLGVLKRQSIVSQLYTFDKLVVEPIDKPTGT
ncbi:hypothetical protein TBLA_0D04220 [Henningerozyma blattae CBS 6284]|uniref:Complex 1 LYR protein domain-containing protein n=1 Tax=Henningerozyma blattae (strain ATCC 34711 / CBS 6284 / DSM 70876 / NBRC 10599 / NRRL Y-10934 / UCD 77-7) TaxID=1071380 RepID=I2H3G7_HENB6|nr:hypothetical protein TBLA_0D04220 [Tetrapisispora blattae CBS 6284]CCH60919.1 hypothetical protein TBLA_0D04220 [Tetrapisispora blattae CBS 6284]